MTKFLTIFVLVVFYYLGQGQELGSIICPLEGDTVHSEQLLIVVQLKPDINLRPASVDLIINQLSYKHFIKIKNDKLTVLITSPVKRGNQTINLLATSFSGKHYDLRWDIYVAKRKKPIKEKKGQNLYFLMDGFSRITEVSGEGSNLRQEPPQTHQIQLKGSYQNGDIELPFKFLINNFEQANLQPRDRFFTGIKYKNTGISFGDQFPKYHSLVLSGSRIRGIEGFYQFRFLKINLIYGQVNRAIEGLKLLFNNMDDFTLPPVYLQDIVYDTSNIRGFYYDNGTYSRNLMAANFEIGTAKNNNKLNLTILKSTDDTTSISFGGQAAQNFSLGINHFARTKTKNIKLKSGVAAAFTTRDIRNGVATEQNIEDIYDIDLPFSTQNIRHLLIYNSTSTIPDNKSLSFLSYYVKPEFRLKHQTITIELKRIGSAYQSFGNPYLIKDRLIASITDKMHFFDHKLNAQFCLKHYHNNLARSSNLRYYTQMADASFTLVIQKNWPQLTGGARYYVRSSHDMEYDKFDFNYLIKNYFGGINYSGKVLNTSNVLCINYNFNQRQYNELQKETNTHSLYAGLDQIYKFGLTIDLEYNYLLLTNDTSDFGQNNTYTFNAGYLNKSKKVHLEIGARQLNVIETIFFPASENKLIYTRLKYKIKEHFQIELEAGYSTYVEKNNSFNNYEEWYGQLHLIYRFNKKWN